MGKMIHDQIIRMMCILGEGVVEKSTETSGLIVSCCFLFSFKQQSCFACCNSFKSIEQDSICLFVFHFQNLHASGATPQITSGPADESTVHPLPREPRISTVVFNKVNGSMGLSIVAAKVCGLDIGR